MIRCAERFRLTARAGTAVLCFFATAALATWALPARAQGQGAPAPAVVGDASAQDGIADVVITAQRREEKLQQVPLSVTAITGETLQNADVTEVDRIEQIAPGVRIGRSGSDARPAIRGTYTENIGANGDPRIGIYVDDIYQSRTSEVQPLVDLERVEVQKGPQGTLFGRNSFGGNITFNSVAPKDEFSAAINGLYGSYNRGKVDGYINVPISPGIAARVAGLYEYSDGYVKNIGTGSDLGDTNQYYFRGSLRIAPPEYDRLEILLHATYWNQNDHGLFGFGYKQLGSLVDIPLITQPGGSITKGGHTYTFPNGFNGSSFSGTPTSIDTRYRDGRPDINGVDIGVATDPNPYHINNDNHALQRTQLQEYSGTINFDAGPVKLRSITSYADFSANRSGDDGTPAPYFVAYQQTKARTYTEEVQALSNDAASPFQWIVGGYYYDDTIQENGLTAQNRNYSTAIALANGLYPLYTFGFNDAPTLAGNGIAQYRSDSESPIYSKTVSRAVYGQASYEILDNLTATLGYRYTADDKGYVASLFNASAAGSKITGVPAYFVYNLEDPISFTCGKTVSASSASNASNTSSALLNQCGGKTFTFDTYHAALDYRFTPDNMGYVSYSTGRHSGGFNNTLDPTTKQLIPFGPEKVQAYEIGTKNQFLDHRLQINLAGYYNDYRDLQAQTSIPNPALPNTSVLALVQNIGHDIAYGADLDAIYKVTRDLTFNVATNYLYAREVDYKVNTFSYGFCGIVAGGCAGFPSATLGVQGTPFPNPVSDPNRFVPVLDKTGRQIVVGGIPQYLFVIAGKGRDGKVYTSEKSISPEWTFQAGLTYNINLEDYGSLVPEVQTYFNSGYILTDLTPNFGNQKAYTKTDLRLTYYSLEGNFSAQAFVENIEDTPVINRVAYSSNRSLSVNYAIPQTWGVRLGYRF